VANYASRRAREVSEREGRVAAFAKLVGAQREEADREIAERDRNLATLQGIIDALKAHTKTEEDNVVRLETVVKDREATIADLTARHDTLGKQNNENEQMNRNHEKTIERLNKQSLDDMTAVIEKHRKDLEATRLQHETDMNTFAQKSVTAASDELKAENADLSRQVQALQTLVASNAASRAALAAADTAQKAMIKQLSQELAKEKAELKVVEAEDLTLTTEKHQSEKTIRELTSEFKLIEKELKQGEKSFAGALDQYDKTFDPAMTRAVDAAGLGMLLTSQDWAGFYAAIKEANPKREMYSPSALFLVLESMAGTWQMFERDGLLDVIVRKLVYDRRLWDTIENAEKYGERETHYNSKHLGKFRAAFGLVAPAKAAKGGALSPLPVVAPVGVLPPELVLEPAPAAVVSIQTRPRTLTPLPKPPTAAAP
jgi:hypothetical protein